MIKNIYSVLVIVTLSLIAVQAQKNKQERLFLNVPAEIRSQLLARIKLYVQFENRQDYQHLYDLLSDETKRPKYLEKIGGYSSTNSKSSYARFRKEHYPKVVDFIPTSIKSPKAGIYEIRGQATLRYKRGLSKQERVLFASLEHGLWYFSELNQELID